jgi:Cu2+-containing amine oxidase
MVSYRGKRVLRRANVPILNVRYDGDACGPYRDWQNEEGRFQAQGAAVAPGFRLCPQPATTVLETGSDHGNFAGVAVYVDGDEVVLVSELEAGWYRYISRWHLHANGTIRPRFGFGAVENPCVCNTHHHHVYWRLDFDIAGAGDDLVGEYNDPPLAGHDGNWHRLTHEIRRKRSSSHKRRWRVRNRATGAGYELLPGADDGAADSFGIGDFWALRYRSTQLDDSAVATSERAGLDSFLNGESTFGTNVVVWYAAHFTHDPAHEGEHEGGSHIVGPTLRPSRW